MTEITKCDAIAFAASVKKLVDALVAEGFDDFYAKDFVKDLYSHRVN